MAAFIDCYAVLGVSENASDTEIKTAYRCGLKRYHPDLHPNDKNATEKTKEVIYAYETLSDSSKRANFNQQLRQRRNNTNSFNASSNKSNSSYYNDIDDDEEDIDGEELINEMNRLQKEIYKEIIRNQFICRDAHYIIDMLNELDSSLDFKGVKLFETAVNEVIDELRNEGRGRLIKNRNLFEIQMHINSMLSRKIFDRGTYYKQKRK